MKTQDLWIPCSFKDRRPLIIDNFIYIPQYYDRHEDFNFPGFVEIFQNDNPIHIEYCSGNGQWVCEKASNSPDINWVAVEKKFDRARKIWARTKRDNLCNVFVVFGDAYIFSEKYLQDNSVSKAFVNFPDPWPKKKHSKNRLIQADFISSISKVLENNKIMVIVTDHNEYSRQIMEVFSKHQNWEIFFYKTFCLSDFSNYGNSFFSDLFNKMGKEIFYMEFQNKK